MSDFQFKIIKHIGFINDKSVWKKELNLISWDSKEAKFDIRSWDETHEKMSKGVTLSKDELINLKELLNKINIDEAYNVGKPEDNAEIDDIFDELS